jgi:outer membrane receptor protein involved in Fe transport
LRRRCRAARGASFGCSFIAWPGDNNGIHRTRARSCVAHYHDGRAVRLDARSIWSRETVKDGLTSDSNAELKLLTGPVAHKLLFGADYRVLKERAQSGFATDPTPFDLYAPVYTGVTPPALSSEPDLRQSQLGLYVQDQMRLGPWLAIVGLRQDYVTATSLGRRGKIPRRPPAAPG